MKICQVCGKTIDFSSRATKYCSPECRARVKYEKDRAWFVAHPEKAKEYGRNWYAANAEWCRRVAREKYRRKCVEGFEEEG